MTTARAGHEPQGPDAGDLLGVDESALAVGRVRLARVRSKPRVPSWALKVVMAGTGVVFALFVFVHMIGNLKVFTGAEHFNEYAHWLRTVLQPLLPYEGLLWILRLVLLGCLIAHVWSAALIAQRARGSRGPHRRPGMWIQSFTARTMPVTGLVLLGFIVVHLLDLTTGTAGVAADTFRPATPEAAHAYHNLIASLQRPLMAFAYMVTMLALFLHLAHGLWTVVSDVGVTGTRLRRIGYVTAGCVALAVTLGNIVIPLAVLTGMLA